APGQQGQYSLPDGQQSMQFTQVATDGGLMPFPIVRNSFELWPAKRREVVVDFKKYMDGTPTTKGDVLYLVNLKQMTNGRKPNESTMTLDDGTIVPDPEFDPRIVAAAPRREFELMRSGQFGGEVQWLINGLPFDPTTPLAFPQRDV